MKGYSLSPDCPFKNSCNHYNKFLQSLQTVQIQDSPVYIPFIKLDGEPEEE